MNLIDFLENFSKCNGCSCHIFSTAKDRIATSDASPLHPIQRLQRHQQRLRPLSPISLRSYGFVHLLGQSQARQAQVHLLGFGQGDAHVLDEVLDVPFGRS
jgi:hypothetical protein